MSALINLACAFPAARNLRGGCTTIADLNHGIKGADRLFVTSKAAAVTLIVQANMERAAQWGHGNRAAKRAAHIETAQWFDSRPLTGADLDAMAEQHAEGRIFKRSASLSLSRA
jgi:hypothetical protein